MGEVVGLNRGRGTIKLFVLPDNGYGFLTRIYISFKILKLFRILIHGETLNYKVSVSGAHLKNCHFGHYYYRHKSTGRLTDLRRLCAADRPRCSMLRYERMGSRACCRPGSALQQATNMSSNTHRQCIRLRQKYGHVN